MSGLGEHDPAFQKSAGGVVAPSDIDRYEIYQIIGPMIGTVLWGTITGTNAQVKTLTLDQVMADYPRNVEIKLLPASGSIAGGTFTVYGKNQFGDVQSEDFAIGTAVDGGTTVGTKIFATFASVSGTIGTGDAGASTVTLYPACTGTTALFGLPSKIASTLDVKMMSFGSTGVAKAVNGGTVGGFVNTAVHAIKAPNTITTPTADLSWINVWYKSSWKNEFKPDLAAL
jgi:hypothetical protein